MILIYYEKKLNVSADIEQEQRIYNKGYYD